MSLRHSSLGQIFVKRIPTEVQIYLIKEQIASALSLLLEI